MIDLCDGFTLKLGKMVSTLSSIQGVPISEFRLGAPSPDPNESPKLAIAIFLGFIK